MILNLGDYAVDSTVYVPFHTFDSNDPSASVTITGLAVTDIEIYKDGSATQRSSDSGYSLLDTDGIDFDGITGLHGFSIDLSDNTDTGFFAAGSQYWVAVSAITVDAATINFWAAIFTIERSGGSATVLTDTEAVLADTEAAVPVLTDTEAILSDTELVLTDSEAILTDAENIVADTNELQTDWTDAGRLDAILDAVLVDTEAAVTDTEAILSDSEAVLSDSETLIAGVDVTSISGDSTAADRLEALMDGIIIGQVNDASATTTAFAADNFTEATDDHFNGRLITFITGALTGQQTDITDYDASGGTQGEQEFTVTALTEAPANDVFFVIH